MAIHVFSEEKYTFFPTQRQNLRIFFAKNILKGGWRRYWGKATLMRRIGTLLVFAALLMAGCAREEGHEALLKGFYEEYLTLCCPPHGEQTDWTEVQQLVQRYTTYDLFQAWELSHNAELDSWIDYDMFIQGQDCWPGIRAERIERIGESQWYVVTVVQHASDNPDSMQKSDDVFFHLTKGDDDEWLIECIDDVYNRLGTAPHDQEATLRSHLAYRNKIVIT